MLGSLFKAAIKVAVLPVNIAVDTLVALPETADGEKFMKRTRRSIESIADDLDDVL